MQVRPIVAAERKPGFFVKVKDGENFNRKKIPGVFYELKFEPNAETDEKDNFRSATIVK